MSTNINLCLDTRAKKQDGTYPLIMRLGHKRKTLPIPLNVSLSKADWNNNTREVKSSYSDAQTVARLNNIISTKRKNAKSIIIKLDESGQLQNLTIHDVRARIIHATTSICFYAYTEQLVAELEKAKRYGTADTYKCISDVLYFYLNPEDKEILIELRKQERRAARSKNGDTRLKELSSKTLPSTNLKLSKPLFLNQITYGFLKTFEAYHLSKDGNTYNGFAAYMRTLRSIYNKAINEGLAEEKNYPFEKYKIKTTDTRKRALQIDPLKTIINKNIQDDDPLFIPRSYFIASLMMNGMSFIDMAFFRKDSIINGRINYQRKKTSKHYDIKIMPNLEKILKCFIEAHPDSPYVFPILKGNDLKAQHNDNKWNRKRYNTKLKELATLCGIQENLTSYVSRHSFATQAMLNNVPVNAISAMLGHTSIKTTQIYLASLPTEALDEYHRQAISFI